MSNVKGFSTVKELVDALLSPGLGDSDEPTSSSETGEEIAERVMQKLDENGRSTARQGGTTAAAS